MIASGNFELDIAPAPNDLRYSQIVAGATAQGFSTLMPGMYLAGSHEAVVPSRRG